MRIILKSKKSRKTITLTRTYIDFIVYIVDETYFIPETDAFAFPNIKDAWHFAYHVSRT